MAVSTSPPLTPIPTQKQRHGRQSDRSVRLHQQAPPSPPPPPQAPGSEAARAAAAHPPPTSSPRMNNSRSSPRAWSARCRNATATNDTLDIEKESEFLSKSHGLYLEYNRAKTGTEKDWMYMVRVTVPGGGAFNADQWQILNQVADDYCHHNPYGGNSLRLTTRQNIQYHWLQKPQVMSLVQDIARTGFYTLNGCGDNVRNVMGCPLSKFTTLPGASAFELAHKYGEYFRLPAAPHIQVFAVDPSLISDPRPAVRLRPAAAQPQVQDRLLHRPPRPRHRPHHLRQLHRDPHQRSRRRAPGRRHRQRRRSRRLSGLRRRRAG